MAYAIRDNICGSDPELLLLSPDEWLPGEGSAVILPILFMAS